MNGIGLVNYFSTVLLPLCVDSNMRFFCNAIKCATSHLTYIVYDHIDRLSLEADSFISNFEEFDFAKAVTDI